MLYERILNELDRRKIKYLVVGGLAVNLHGYDRVPVALKDFAVPRLRKSWIKEKNMKALTLYNPRNDAEHVDIIIDQPVDFQKAYKKREQIRSGGMNISLISLADLIRMKEAAGRERDKIDIKALTFIKELKND